MTRIGSNPTQNAESSELLPINWFITYPGNPRKEAEFICLFKKYIMQTDLHEEYQKYNHKFFGTHSLIHSTFRASQERINCDLFAGNTKLDTDYRSLGRYLRLTETIFIKELIKQRMGYEFNCLKKVDSYIDDMDIAKMHIGMLFLH